MTRHKPIAPLSHEDVERFWSLVDRRGPEECWPWTGSRFKDSVPPKKRKVHRGYPRFYITRDGQTVSLRPNRIALYLKTGIDPGELQACLTCQNILCVNGAHLFAGTDQDRMDECVAKDRQAKGDAAPSRLYPGIRKGELSGLAKLTEVEVREILELAKPAIEQGRTLPGRRLPKGLIGEIRNQMGSKVTYAMIARILRGECWTHLAR